MAARAAEEAARVLGRQLAPGCLPRPGGRVPRIYGPGAKGPGPDAGVRARQLDSPSWLCLGYTRGSKALRLTV